MSEVKERRVSLHVLNLLWAWLSPARLRLVIALVIAALVFLYYVWAILFS